MILVASKRRALVAAQHSALPVPDVLSEEIDPEGRLPPVAEPSRVAQLVAELRLVGEREQVKDRVHGRVDIHQGFVPNRAPAEHVGDHTLAKPDAPVGFDDEVLPVHERKPRLVDGEVETAETPPVLSCRSVAVGVAPFINHHDVESFRRPPGHHGPEHPCLLGADRTATGRTVLEPAMIVTVADGKPRALEIEFATGDAVALDGEPMSPASLLARLNDLGGAHGVGQQDIVENRYVGMKSRGCYETPGGTILLKAHRARGVLFLARSE